MPNFQTEISIRMAHDDQIRHEVMSRLVIRVAFTWPGT